MRLDLGKYDDGETLRVIYTSVSNRYILPSTLFRRIREYGMSEGCLVCLTCLQIFAGSFEINGDKTAVFAGVAMANLFCAFSHFSLVVGMSTAVETLCSQLYGAKKYDEVGIVLQRAIVVLSVWTIPVFILWLNCRFIFVLMRMNETVIDVSMAYLHIRLIAVPMDVLNVSYGKYLMAMGVVQCPMFSNITFVSCMVILNSIYIYGLHFDYRCLAWVYVIATYAAGLIQFISSLKYEQVQLTLQYPNMAALSNIGTFLQLGFPGLVQMCSEWWAFEALTFMASLLGEQALAAQSIIL